ncbi:MAG: hypothetical protein MUE81_06220, partial [Thermoflexibacter sp.]|nr:hypothetical protein [Thermoflexibacter sp.]
HKNILELTKNGFPHSQWLIKSQSFPIENHIKIALQNDDKAPIRLKEAFETEIQFVIPLENEKIIPVPEQQRLIFTYLPTSINFNFPFLVNASFLTDAGRQKLHEDNTWNQYLFEKIAWYFFMWIAEIAKNKEYKNHFLQIIPNKLKDSAFSTSFNTSYDKAVSEIAFIPNLQGDLLKVGNAIFDKTNISTNTIHKETLLEYINNKFLSISSFVPYLEPIIILKRLGVKIFDIEDLKGFLSSDIFKREHKLEENFKLILFLYEQSERSKDEEGRSVWNEKLRNTAFIFDEKENLESPKNIYFPAVQFTDDFKADLCIIHSEVFLKINEKTHIRNWLVSLGIQEPTDISFIEKTIIGQGDIFITTENAIQVGRYLFNAHKKGILQDGHYEKLQSLKLLTKENSLVTAENSFLSNFYEPELRLESAYKNDFYVSENYLEGKDLKSEWKTFLLKIAVSQSLSWVEQEVYQTQGRFDKSYFELKTGFPNYGYANSILSYKINKVSFVELCVDNYQFSKLFWHNVLTNNLATQYDYDKGYCFYFKWRSLGIIPYFHWLIENIEIVPTTQKNCRKSSEVFSNNIPQINEIAGKYLPVFDYNEAVPPEWLKLLNFKPNLEFDNYLEILAAIWQDNNTSEEEQKENKERISLIYKELASLNLHQEETQRISVWGETNKLLSKGGYEFYLPKDLSIVDGEGFEASNLAYLQKITTETIELMRLFGVKIIDNIFAIMPDNKFEIKSFKNKLSQIAPLIALIIVGKSGNSKDWEEEYIRIVNKLSYMYFFETSEIILSYGDEKYTQKRSSWVEVNNFYYVGNWYSPRVLDGLVEPLGKFLNIRSNDNQRILTVLILESFANGIEYLKEKGYDTSIIDNTKISTIPQSYKDESPVNNPSFDDYYDTIGRAGEEYVFYQLIQFYQKEYNTQGNVFSGGIFEIAGKVRIMWYRQMGEPMKDHDIYIEELGKKTCIEVKSTEGSYFSGKQPLFSDNQISLIKTSEKFLVARVFNATTNPSMELIKLEMDSFIT